MPSFLEIKSSRLVRKDVFEISRMLRDDVNDDHVAGSLRVNIISKLVLDVMLTTHVSYCTTLWEFSHQVIFLRSFAANIQYTQYIQWCSVDWRRPGRKISHYANNLNSCSAEKSNEYNRQA